MSRIFLVFSLVLFGSIACLAWLKKDKKEEVVLSYTKEPKEIVLVETVEESNDQKQPDASALVVFPKTEEKEEEKPKPEPPFVDRIEGLFTKGGRKLPIVETILYRSQVDWLPGRPAWIADYAAHYKTSRHFIARSLNGKADYKKQDVAIGDRFNVLRTDIDLSFYLVIDTSRAQLWLYAYNKSDNERILLKRYDVGLGRRDPDQVSGYLTPNGTYKLGDKVAIYEPGKFGWVQGKKIEMVRVFGTRWIPLEEEVEGCTAPPKGYGIHGFPWKEDRSGKLAEDSSLSKQYASDGCIRLRNDDIEEIFAIIITRPSFVIIVDDYYKAKVPGEEKLLGHSSASYQKG
jgi:hypothetical protein